MTTLKESTKRGGDFVRAYWNSRNCTLSDCYGTFSTAKSWAEYECRRTMSETGGSGFRILSYNTFGFTFGWMTADGDFRVETPGSTYLIKFDLTNE